ncbi:MAG: OmpA family protein [Alphaproteobacteria bacterium HGW-Alphaproteobacteria-2]|nr:MAG: OmpA family protein [Alphaproteobacteria bacterium HGW-Alphaproteobacteria-2]
MSIAGSRLRFIAFSAALMFVATQATAQYGSAPSERFKPAIWIDPDGCEHYVIDDGWEGYGVERVHPRTGMPICHKMNTCRVENADTLFATDSARLRPGQRERLHAFFRQAGATAYAIYGHTDSRASDEYNIRLSEQRAQTVADVAQSAGARVARVMGFGERRPIASDTSPAGMQKNRRVEIVCYR